MEPGEGCGKSRLRRREEMEDTISDALGAVCSTISSIMSTPCQALLDLFRDKITEVLQSNKDSHEFCGQIRMCHDNSSDTQVMALEDSLKVPEQCLQGPKFWCQDWEMASLCMREQYCMELWQNMPLELEEPDGETSEKSLKRKKKNKRGKSSKKKNSRKGTKKNRRKGKKNKSPRRSSVKCKACTLVMGTLQSMIGNDADDDAINDALDTVCDSINVLLRIPCQALLNQFRDQITEALQNNQDSQEFCTQIRMCRNNPSDTQVVALEDSLKVPEQCLQGPKFWCQDWEMASLCMREQYCMELWQNMPLELEDSDGEKLEESLKKKKKKNKKNCHKSSKKKKRRKGKKNKSPKRSSVKCTACTKVIGTLKNMIGKDADDDAIDDAVSTVCDDLDGAVATECNGMMELYKDQIIDALKNEADPEEFCTQINLCGAALEPWNEPETVAFAPTTTNSCTICQTFTSLVTPKLNNDQVESDFEQALESRCEELFGESSQCKDFIAAYGAKMKQVLHEPLDHVTTCLEIKACRPEGQATMMGSDSECQKGPPYWCQSVQAAIRCNALAFCTNSWSF
ncbi:uncharacterized protein LOC115092872 isoform X2 [Rhinatrema bivittatum]|uniref:uncharacterized protein LOC115092872 isoform X2 n=1 Tax=Rhinatrema bivittatum TaxID=194408 RepID=UPI00112A09B4|nr:uncharacterized protein LOC115092872 isoform X2 [Rhinatrema bivittatum]